MSYQNISSTIAEEDLQSIVSMLKEVENKLSFTIYLSVDDLKKINVLGDRSIPFVEKSIELANQNPKMLPGYLNIEEMKRDFEMSKKLRSILHILGPLTERVRDTQYAVGSEAFDSALNFYRIAKAAAKGDVPGTDAIVKELAKRFFSYGSSKKSDEEVKGKEKEDKQSSTG